MTISPEHIVAERSFVRALPLLVCLLMGTACKDSVTEPTVPLDSRFTLAPGELAAIEPADASVRFNAVEGDSRCPGDALCITGGDARVRISILSGGSQSDYDLHTGSMAPVRHRDLTVALVELSPYPFSFRTIKPDEYRATLRVTR
jgi:hypothetical protein